MRCILFLTTLVNLLTCSRSQRVSKNVKVSVEAKFCHVPLVCEASEFFGEFSDNTYWKFVEKAKNVDSEHFTTEQLFRWVEAVAGSDDFRLTSSLSVLEYSLAIHHYTPKIEMYQQLLVDHFNQTGEEMDPSCSALLFSAASGKFVCGLDELTIPSDTSQNSVVDILEVDHEYLGSNTDGSIVVYYGEIGSAAFAQTHDELSRLSTEGKIRYILRPKVPVTYQQSSSLLKLQGYGVELDIKNMEYKVIDDSKIDHDSASDQPEEEIEAEIQGFNFPKLIQHRPALEENLMSFRDYLLANQDDDATVNVWNMRDLGVQASQRIIQSEDPFKLLQELSQNFPTYGMSLTKIKVDEGVREEIANHQLEYVTPGKNLVSLNGLSFSPENIDVFTLQSVFFGESLIIDGLSMLHLPHPTIRKLLEIPIEKPSDSEQLAVDMRTTKDTVIWLNDIEKDDTYSSWPKRLKTLLQPGWPNQIRYVRRNLYHIVLIADPSTLEGLLLITSMYDFVQNNLPANVGIVFAVSASPSAGWDQDMFPLSDWEDIYSQLAVPADDTDDVENTPPESQEAEPQLSSVITTLFKYIFDESGKDLAFEFLGNILQASDDDDADPSLEDTKSAYDQYVSSQSNAVSLEGVLNFDRYTRFVSDSSGYLQERGISGGSLPSLVVNGVMSQINLMELREKVMVGILRNQQMFQMLTYEKTIDDNTDFDNYIYDQEHVIERHSSLMESDDSSYSSSLSIPKNLFKFHTSEESEREFYVKGLNFLLACDASSIQGLKMLQSSIEFLQTQELKNSDQGNDPRVAFVWNSASSVDGSGKLFDRLLLASENLPLSSLQKVVSLVVSVHQNPALLRQAVERLIKISGDEFDSLSLGEVFDDKNAAFAASSSKLKEQQRFITSILQLEPATNAIILNGQIYQIGDDMGVSAGDFVALSLREYSRVEKVVEIMNAAEFVDVDPDDMTTEFMSDILMNVCYLIGKRSTTGEPVKFPIPTFAKSSLSSIHHKTESPFQIKALLDPLSKAAQRLSPVLEALKNAFDIDITVFLNPMPKIGENPLKRFYRYVVSPELIFNKKTGELERNVYAEFRNLPKKQVLTMGVDTPEAWLVESKHAVYDLDNILLEDLPGKMSTLHVDYQLKHLLVSGQCVDTKQRKPASGLQLMLGTVSSPHLQDTIVMENLGYFQLKADAGVWYIQLAPGRGREIFTVDDSSSSDTALIRDGKLKVAISGFAYPAVFLRVKRQQGMEMVDLLAEEELGEEEEKEEEVSVDVGADGQAKGIWNSWFGEEEEEEEGEEEEGGGDEIQVVEETGNDETIHVFSLASGHLYERFLKIMMLSVIKNTENPVKFWFLEQFLSPQFKKFAPEFAQHYGFEVEFVTYKWPVWLRQQTEKQRIIWGYKILFLDVLFPIKIKRIIFVDADQIVRADLKELWELDLEGAPYAYTPFCDSNEATKGFRFWDSGYWKQHLQGKPYHISALYVIDLQKFRQLRAGDSLRIMYDQLSRDPNSLANLDQDLPNYAQNSVEIYSLPQDWLWCETWCSMGSLETAKTIDLCNNPLTKEPKLERAKRFVAEWTSLDEEAEAFPQKLNQKLQNQSHEEHKNVHKIKTEL